MIPRHQYTKEEYKKINKEFPDNLEYYYTNDRPESFLKKVIWPIVLECSINCTVQKFHNLTGKGYFNRDKMEEWALEAAMILIGRITNEEKYPNGYRIKYLPTTIYYALLDVAKQHQKAEKELQLMEDLYDYFTEKAAGHCGGQVRPHYNEC